jgi:type VI secretion system protein
MSRTPSRPTPGLSRPSRPARPRRLHLSALALLLLAGLGGCAGVGQVAKAIGSATANTFGGPPVPQWLSWEGLLLQASPDANQSTAVAVDVLFVRDAELLQTLQALPAAKWFATREELQRTWPDGLRVHSVELVPGQSLRLNEALLGSPRVSGVLIFADYLAPGEHRARLPEDFTGATVLLGPRGFTLAPLRTNTP